MYQSTRGRRDYLYTLPYGVRTNVVNFLSINEAWKKLAAVLNFSSLEIDLFEVRSHRKSPAETFWIEYSTLNPTIADLFCALAEIKHYLAMRELLPYVPRILHSKIPGLEDDSALNITVPSQPPTIPVVSATPQQFHESCLPGPESRISNTSNIDNYAASASSIYNQGFYRHHASVPSAGHHAAGPGIGVTSQISELSDCDNTHIGMGLVPTAPQFPSIDASIACALRDTQAIPNQEIYDATDGFSAKHEVAHGNNSKIYNYVCPKTKNRLTVKRLMPSGELEEDQRQHDHFVQVIQKQMKYRNENIVQLYGYSMDSTPDLCLVYEYLANGSLKDRILCKGQTAPLTWQQRISIMSDMARGLLYLHNNNVIHLNLKSSNVLLDEHFKAKLTDIGKAVVALDSNGRTIIDGKKFTQSYKESSGYFMRDFLVKPTFKSDIFSLGIIIGELYLGMEAFDEKRAMHEHYLFDILSDKEEDKLMNAMDPRAGNWPKDISHKIIKLCKNCVSENESTRPDIVSVCSEFDDITLMAKQTSYAVGKETGTSDVGTDGCSMYDKKNSLNRQKNFSIISDVPSSPQQLIMQPTSADYKPIYPTLCLDQESVHSFSSAHSMSNRWNYDPYLDNLAPPDVNAKNDNNEQKEPNQELPQSFQRRKKKAMWPELEEFINKKSEFYSINPEMSHGKDKVFEEEKAPPSHSLQTSIEFVGKNANDDNNDKQSYSISSKSVRGNQVIIVDDDSSDSDTESFWSNFALNEKKKKSDKTETKNTKMSKHTSSNGTFVNTSSLSSLDPGYLDTDINVDDFIRSCDQKERKSKAGGCTDQIPINDKKKTTDNFDMPTVANEERMLSDVFDSFPSTSLGQADEFLALESLDIPHNRPLPPIDAIPSVDSQDYEDFVTNFRSIAVSSGPCNNDNGDQQLSSLFLDGVSGPPVI
ncbi:uncharacterized protein LOC141902630 [Tubulanus polymorphus]|uniref:uncharacterized protein LOC141902630 n=1 Tax=Tubulanus polymorphus TaxID=672921 RepID=UPI003DA21716